MQKKQRLELYQNKNLKDSSAIIRIRQNLQRITTIRQNLLEIEESKELQHITLHY